MILDKFTPLTFFSIKEPRWHDKRVLLKVDKVNRSPNKFLKVRFQKYITGDWVIAKSVVKRYPKESNSVIMCYSVPLDKLEPLEISNKSMMEVW